MLHISFEGGLGNQMFQYAFARYLQKQCLEPVQADISKYVVEANEIRNFELKSFNISPSWKFESINSSRVRRLGGWKYLLYLAISAPYLSYNKRRVSRGLDPRFNDVYQEVINSFGYYRVHYGPYRISSNLSSKTKYIRGHWFSKEVVTSISSIVRNELRVITPISEDNQITLKNIKSTNSVGVHIRRGDYVSLGMVVCDIDYYKYCMDQISDKIDNPVYFIFSDDIEWVKQNLKTSHQLVYVDNNNTAPDDMRLLYSCKHFIMSNSTFSWWGAYLGNFANKIVFAPRYWDQNRRKSSLLLDDWFDVENI